MSYTPYICTAQRWLSWQQGPDDEPTHTSIATATPFTWSSTSSSQNESLTGQLSVGITMEQLSYRESVCRHRREMSIILPLCVHMH